MKKEFLIQAMYVVISITILSSLWEFVFEDLLFESDSEDFSEKIEYVIMSVTFAIVALIFPVYKGLSLIRYWKELEKTLIDQGLQLEEIDNKKLDSLDSIKSILTDELGRRKKVEDEIKEERQKFFSMLDQLPICFHLQASDYTIPFANKMFRERFGSPETACAIN